jgi:hypothetical protein
MEEESVEALLDLVLNDDAPDVLNMAAIALDDYKDERISPSLARLINHPSDDVRHGVVWALLGREDETAVQSMIALSDDTDADIRNWATFGLARQIKTNTPEIRDALLRRVQDENSEVRAEALLGLAYKDDDRIIGPLIAELLAIAEADNYWDLVFEAAAIVGDPSLYPELMALREDDIEDNWFEVAIAACRIPESNEGNDVPDNADTTCPVCGLPNAFSDPDSGFCARCGWQADTNQRADPDLAERTNWRSLRAERIRWQARLGIARHRGEPENR